MLPAGRRSLGGVLACLLAGLLLMCSKAECLCRTPCRQCPHRPPLSARPPACRIEKACLGTIAEGKYLTRDLGGKSGTSDFTKAIIGRLDD